MPTPEEIEVAELLLRKGASDRDAARLLASDSHQLDDVVGFRVHQAVEKSIKAVLAIHGFEFPRTHDLTHLAGLVAASGLDIPHEVVESEWLAPWGVTMRYDEPAAPIDRAAAVKVAARSIAWAHDLIDAALR